MCKFFSFVSDGHGRVRYFNWEQREILNNGKLVDGNGNRILNPDSHSSIMAYYGIYGKDEDKWNKYEYNPLTDGFKTDQMNTRDDREEVMKWVRELDFKTVVEPLVIKPIVDPRYVEKHEVDGKVLDLLDEWIEIYGLIQRNGLCYELNIVEFGIFKYIYQLIINLLLYYKNTYTLDSVNNFIVAYASSFLSVKQFQCAVDLWEMGFVASYDGQTWRLHQGENMEVVYERRISAC